MPPSRPRSPHPIPGDRLPVPLTPILGRQRELAETELLLRTTRLLTVTGAGGSGKTRIALELARRVREQFRDGAVWVDLAPLSDPDLIGQQILNALGLREMPAQDAVEVVIDTIGERSVLLVFDNCEHLVDRCAAIAEELLRACAAATIVTTTREALGIPGEQTWLVPPLASNEAMQLFAERARAVVPSFTVDDANRDIIASICSRLDGIPLAIELAAARVKVLSPAEIAARLDDAFRLLTSGSRTLPRHRTIRETIDWSFRLLTADDQRLLRRLSVFHGSFSLAEAEAICGADCEVLDSLTALVDKSLVQRDEAAGETRYRLLETVRQFAAEKLDEAGEVARFRGAHAAFFVSMAEELEPRIFGGAADVESMRRIDDEIGNIRAVFDWIDEDASRGELALRLAYALHWYWFARGHFFEARRRVLVALERARDADATVLARAQIAAAHAAVWQADWAAVRDAIGDPAELVRASRDPRDRALAHMLAAIAQAFTRGDVAAARDAFGEAVRIAESSGGVVLPLVLYWSGTAAQWRGDAGAARRDFEAALAAGLELGNKPAIAHPSTLLGHLSLQEGKTEEALVHLRRAIEVHAEIDDRWGLTQAVEGIGIALLDSGDAENGTRLLAAAAAAWLQLGARPGRDEAFELEKDRRISEAVDDDRLRVVLASGAAMRYDEMVALARAEAERLASPAAVVGRTKAATVESVDGAMQRLRVRALGPLEIWRGDELLDLASQSARARELLLFLLVHPNGATKEQIGAALWPDVDAAKLRNNFHVTVHRLRKMLGGADWVVASGDSYTLARSSDVEFDAAAFERDVRASLRLAEKDPAAAARLAASLALYRGDFLEGVSGEWMDEVRERLRDLHANALTVLGRAHMASGDFAAAARVYETLVARDDLDEQAARNLMTCLGRTNDREAVARVYRRLAESLRRELRIEPDPATTRLYERFREGREPL